MVGNELHAVVEPLNEGGIVFAEIVGAYCFVVACGMTGPDESVLEGGGLDVVGIFVKIFEKLGIDVFFEVVPFLFVEGAELFVFAYVLEECGTSAVAVAFKED